MRTLVALPIVLPLLAAAVSILVGRWRQAQRIIGVVTLTIVAIVSIVLLVRVDADGITAVQAGGWPAPVGITLVADRFAAIMLAVAALMLLCVLVYAIGQPGAEDTHVGFHPVYLVLASGVASAFLTGDLFNLFVAFEVMLTASYVLITLGGRADQVRTGMTYVVISLLASTLFLIALAFVVRGDRHGQHGRPLRCDGGPAERGPQLARRAAPRRVRHEGGGVPAASSGCPTAIPTAPTPDHRRVRRAADQGRRVRDHPHPDPAVPSGHVPGHAAPRGRRCSRWSSACSAPSPRTT